MNKARRLAQGDTVAMVNPAGMPPERFRRYIPLMERYLKEEGFLVKQYLVDERADSTSLAEVFTEAWCDSDVKAVFPICGGPRIFEVIKNLKPRVFTIKPTLFCGSSALSALSVWLSLEAQIVTFFGPHLSFIHPYSSQRENEFTVQSFWSMVMWKKGRTKRISSVHERQHFFSVHDQSQDGAKISNIYHRPDLIRDEKRRDTTFFSLTQECVEGKMCCITLDALVEMKRQEILPDLSGTILFTETVDCTLDQTKKIFWELSETHTLGGIKALFLTALTERTDRQIRLFPELRDREKIRVLCQNIADILQIPVLFGFPLGHCFYKITLPQGIPCVVDPNEGSLFLLERPVL